jgi:CRISPR/Cas system endoribonuclease Cas6 (RAMP superfamily)
LGLKKYLDILPFKFRSVLSKLRQSSHKLAIETGRYARNRVERNVRYCIFCSNRDIEDEYHFVMVCPVYANIRKQFIKAYFYRRPNEMKFIELLKCDM